MSETTIPRASRPRPQELWEQVLDELRVQIIVGELTPGSRLVETELAHEFGVSRGPVRTALLNLERSGLVTSSARRGAEVASYSSTDIRELYAVRAALEVLAAREAAERCTSVVADQLEAQLDVFEAFRAEGAAFDAAEADLAFHEGICVCSGNRLLLVTWANLADQLAMVMTRAHRDQHLGAGRGGDHRAILAALRANDADAAETATRRHLDGISSAYQELSAATAAPLMS
ncbi:MAG: GntR family transcriptional regulator [Desertimonas sp.]